MKANKHPLQQPLNPNDVKCIIEGEFYPVLKDQLLLLCQDLQTTLKPYELIKIFHRHIQTVIHYDAIEYQNESLHLGIILGVTNQSFTPLEINHPNQMGCFKFYRQSEFTHYEINLLNHWLRYMIYPLKNAIDYNTIHQNATQCSLTGLGNKKQYDEIIHSEIEYAHRYDKPLTMLLGDLDDFKKINDQYGHLVGDLALQTIGNLLKSANRNSDLSFRFGGEEFIILLRNTTLEGANQFANRLLNIINHSKLIQDNNLIELRMSIGLSQLKPKQTAEMLFRDADKALYKAKANGKNQVVSSR